jgi:hypothetical protein
MVMVIVADLGSDVQMYARQFSEIVFPRPENCPNCGQPGELVGHGSYPRHPCNPERTRLIIRVKRFFCLVCHRTVSILPSFCLPHRHYLAATIQIVLDLRYRSASSWQNIRQRFHPNDLPSQTTCREWVAAFGRRSPLYLAHLQRQLASWQLAPGRIEMALDDIAAQPSVPCQLLAAVPHLAAWLKERGIGPVNEPTKWLPTLVRWGYGASIGRLV